MLHTIFLLRSSWKKALREKLGVSWDDFISNNVKNPIRQHVEEIEEAKKP